MLFSKPQTKKQQEGSWTPRNTKNHDHKNDDDFLDLESQRDFKREDIKSVFEKDCLLKTRDSKSRRVKRAVSVIVAGGLLVCACILVGACILESQEELPIITSCSIEDSNEKRNHESENEKERVAPGEDELNKDELNEDELNEDELNDIMMPQDDDKELDDKQLCAFSRYKKNQAATAGLRAKADSPAADLRSIALRLACSSAGVGPSAWTACSDRLGRGTHHAA